MKRHLVTLVLLLVAVVFYLAGLSGAGVVAILAGVGFEAWFWVRVLIKRPGSRTPERLRHRS
jgi:hypothetical protein